MTTAFKDHATSVANKIISLSNTLKDEVETWRDVLARTPESTSKGVNAGFVSKPTNTSGIEIVVDVQAPPDEQNARLRIWAIETTKDSDDNERFNNVQLTYHLGYEKARKLVEQGSVPTRDDFSALVGDPANYLENIVISDQTGRDVQSDQLLGKRYDLDSDALKSLSENLSSELMAAMDTVVGRLEKSASIWRGSWTNRCRLFY